MEELESKFHEEMLNIYKEARRIGYDAKWFLTMVVNMGGLMAAKKLLSTDELQYGFTRLWELHRLDLSVEALVRRPEFTTLFTDKELARAEERLRAHGYFNEGNL